MPYLIDRRHALHSAALVVVLSVRQRGIRALLITSDNSIIRTRTRATTLLKASARGDALTARRLWPERNKE